MRRVIGSSFGKMPTTSALRLTFLVEALGWAGAVQRRAGLAGERHVREHIRLAVVHERAELGPPASELVGDVAPGLARGGAVRLIERLADGGGDNGVLAAGGMSECVPHPVNAAALPRRIENPGHGGLEAGVRVRDDGFQTIQPAGLQPSEKLGPECFGLRWADAQTDDPAPAVVCHRHGDYGGDRDDASVLPDLQLRRVEPEIRPSPRQRAVQELANPVIDILAELGDSALGDAAQPHGLHQLVHTARGYAADPGFLDDRDQRLFRRAARLEKAGKYDPCRNLGTRRFRVPSRVSSARSRQPLQ